MFRRKKKEIEKCEHEYVLNGYDVFVSGYEIFCPKCCARKHYPYESCALLAVNRSNLRYEYLEQQNEKSVKQMRNIGTVAKTLQTLFQSEDAKSDIERVIRNATFTAPEAMYIRWQELHDVMLQHLPVDDREWTENDIQIVSEFSTHSVEEIKQEIANKPR